MTNIGNEIVVRFRDGRIVKGYTYDFKSTREVFHVTEVEDGKKVSEVPISSLKAVFFVKTFEGNKGHQSLKDFSVGSIKNINGLKVKVTFFDGEVMYGLTHGYGPNRKGFFIFPADKESNNERVFIIRESASAVETWR